ncbi:MAG TPA: hypothetical protein VMT54_14945 [Candidatus Cybelea sp.]|nr:hypothetical protein [Candidatus Cybelea sp.]
MRVAVGAGVFAASPATAESDPAPTATVATAAGAQPKTPAYNAFEFIYRQEYDRIILREQNVETGQEVSQVPSEYHLQQYATTQRQLRLEQQQKLLHGSASGGGTAPQAKSGAVAARAAAAAAAVVASTPAKTSPAPAQPSPPAVAAPAPAAHVDIKV